MTKSSTACCGILGLIAVVSVWLAFSTSADQPEQPSIVAVARANGSDARQDSESQTRRKSAHPPKIIPWIEVNAPHARVSKWAHMRSDVVLSYANITNLEHCIEGLPHWAKVTDTVIVLTKPAKINTLYPELMQRKPAGLHIVGGLKTFILKDDYANPDGWRKIAAYAQQVVQITGSNVVVLGSETSLTPFHKGKTTIDYDKLRESLAPLRETGIQFWWHPVRILANSSAFPDREKETTRLVQTIIEVLPDSVFLTAYTSWHGSERNLRGEMTLRKKMIDSVGPDHIHDRIFATPDGYWHYARGTKKRCSTSAEAAIQLATPNGGIIVDIYPGALSWVRIAKEFAQLMQPSPAAVKPQAGAKP